MGINAIALRTEKNSLISKVIRATSILWLALFTLAGVRAFATTAHDVLVKYPNGTYLENLCWVYTADHSTK
jgi:hypothetical protein